jgi:hypothetical protein
VTVSYQCAGVGQNHLRGAGGDGTMCTNPAVREKAMSEVDKPSLATLAVAVASCAHAIPTVRAGT